MRRSERRAPNGLIVVNIVALVHIVVNFVVFVVVAVSCCCCCCCCCFSFGCCVSSLVGLDVKQEQELLHSLAQRARATRTSNNKLTFEFLVAT